MTKTRSTKRALLISVLSLLLCVSMLIGTTYAWFTDTVTSANNIIKSGTLDIVAEYWNGTEWKNVENAADILTGDLWEPGYTDVAYLRVKNVGSLALEYSLGVSILSEKTGINKAGEEFKLSDYIYFDIAEVNGETNAYATREDAMKIATETTKISAGYLKAGELLANSDYVYMAMVAYMPTWVDNVANHNGEKAPEIDLGVNIFATQFNYEEDSFDELYDKDAAVMTVAEANALMAENKDATLIGCNEPDGVLVAPAGYTGTLTMGNVNVAGVQAADTVKIVILGKVTVKATADNTSAISGTKLNISGSGNLTAIAKGKNAFGIGAPNAETVTIEGITIDLVEGGYAYETGTDFKYYKNAPEGGAAIGSNKDDAVITLKDVTVVKAVGGAKAAAIGARYWSGVTVNIIDSSILYAEGGVSAAAIGGSRVSSGANESGNTINITNSDVTAKGGAFGAGIGSGYDTHCSAKQPLCTINITDSTINATGGKYAAGIGSGYHNAALAGEIKNSTVKAASGEKYYKDTYTLAMDIGFGVTDPAREGKQTDSYIIYNGKKITLAEAPYLVKDNAALDAALNSGKTNITLDKGIFILPNSAKGKTLTISGAGDPEDTIIATETSGSYEGCNYALDGSTVVFENITINTTGTTYIGYARCNATYNNCVINNTYTLYGDSTFNNCTFNVSGDNYNIWTWGAPNATFNGCTFNSDGKAMLLYGTENTKLTLNDCIFNDKGGLADLKAAVEIGNDYNKSYELIVNNTVVNGYEINDKGINTGTTLWANKNSMGTDKLNVVVDGVDVY